MLNENLRTIRKNKGFSQEELAARVHVVRQTVSKWEKGLSVPDAELLTRIAEVLEVPVSQLLEPSAVSEAEQSTLAEQLSRINEQLVIRNQRARRIWRIVCIAAIIFAVVFILIPLLLAFVRLILYMNVTNSGTS